MRNLFVLILAFNLISACTQKNQYEIFSPCVSTDSANPWVKNPCIRRSVNWDIT